MKYPLVAACAAGLLCAGAAHAESHSESNVGVFGKSGKTMGDHTYIDQNSEKAASLRKILKNITLPDGFQIELYAVVPDARDMAMAPQGTVLFVGTRKDKVVVISDRDRDGVADEVTDFAP